MNNRFVKVIPITLNNDWKIKLFLYKFDYNEFFDENSISSILNNFTLYIDDNRSSEFRLSRKGLCNFHLGRRGITITVWHFGYWEDTFEIFASSWYTYERNLNSFELLNNNEPICSEYELEHLTKEFIEVKNELNQMGDMF